MFLHVYIPLLAVTVSVPNAPKLVVCVVALAGAAGTALSASVCRGSGAPPFPFFS